MSSEDILAEVLNRVDFKSGVIQEISSERQEEGYILDVRWKRNVHFILYINKWAGCYWYYAERNGEKVSYYRRGKKADDRFFESVQHLVDEIENGNFDFKKTLGEQIAEIVHERQLTSYMNNTKWKEFLHAMKDEMSIMIPYNYKTLFEENENDLWWGRHYDIESFNNYQFKSIEWVKMKPKFYESEHRGRLIEDEKIYYNVEQEFLDLMRKYSIPFVYDEGNEQYIIYGYK